MLIISFTYQKTNCILNYMDQHVVPRQITTFEFKLIGFLTLKQFLYIIVFVLSGVVVFFLIPIPVVNFFSAGLVGFIGIAFAFIPINDRPLDIWVKNFIKKLYTPTQFYYKKSNKAPEFLENIYLARTSNNLITTHVDARKKLAEYMNKQKEPSKTIINNTSIKATQPQTTNQQQNIKTIQTEKDTIKKQSTSPFFVGYVKNSKEIPLPGMLIYIKNNNNKTERILKTNNNGVFATFHKLQEGEYLFECKDVSGKYFFDTIKIQIYKENYKPIIIYSKESI